MKLMLIGGGEIGKGNTTYETKEIDEEIVKMTNKKNPNFLFIGLASSYSDSYYDTIKKIYKVLGCNTAYLKKKNLENNKELSIKKINEADIIYIGGGDTIKLIDDFNKYELNNIIKEKAINNTVIAGISAGAILLSKSGYSDAYILRREKNNYEFIKGLNIFKYNICPHFNILDRINNLKKDIKNKEVYCLDNNTALKIEDNNISIIKSDKKAKAYLVSYNNKYIEKELI